MPAILPCILSSYSVLFSVADWGPCLWSGSRADEKCGTDEPWYLDRKQSRQHRTTGSGADEDRTAAETTDNTTSTRVPVGGCSWSERWRVGDLLPVDVVPAPALLLVITGASVSTTALVRQLQGPAANYVPVVYNCTVVTEVCLWTSTTTTADYTNNRRRLDRSFSPSTDLAYDAKSVPRGGSP